MNHDYAQRVLGHGPLYTASSQNTDIAAQRKGDRDQKELNQILDAIAHSHFLENHHPERSEVLTRIEENAHLIEQNPPMTERKNKDTADLMEILDAQIDALKVREKELNQDMKTLEKALSTPDGFNRMPHVPNARQGRLIEG